MHLTLTTSLAVAAPCSRDAATGLHTQHGTPAHKTWLLSLVCVAALSTEAASLPATLPERRPRPLASGGTRSIHFAPPCRAPLHHHQWRLRASRLPTPQMSHSMLHLEPVPPWSSVASCPLACPASTTQCCVLSQQHDMHSPTPPQFLLVYTKFMFRVPHHSAVCHATRHTHLIVPATLRWNFSLRARCSICSGWPRPSTR